MSSLLSTKIARRRSIVFVALALVKAMYGIFEQVHV